MISNSSTAVYDTLCLVLTVSSADIGIATNRVAVEDGNKVLNDDVALFGFASLTSLANHHRVLGARHITRLLPCAFNQFSSILCSTSIDARALLLLSGSPSLQLSVDWLQRVWEKGKRIRYGDSKLA